MNKVIKNFLITVVLTISIIFLKNTICLGYNYEDPENNFKEFENIKYTIVFVVYQLFIAYVLSALSFQILKLIF